MASPPSLEAEALPASGEPEPNEFDLEKKHHRQHGKFHTKTTSSAGLQPEATAHGDAVASIVQNTAPTTKAPTIRLPGGESKPVMPPPGHELTSSMTSVEVSVLAPQASAMKLEGNECPAQQALSTDAASRSPGPSTAPLQDYPLLGASGDEITAASQASGPVRSEETAGGLDGSMPEALMLTSPADSLFTPRRSDIPKEVTNTASYLQLSPKKSPSSRSLAGEECTQTGKIVVDPQSPSSCRVHPEVMTSEAPATLEDDDTDSEDDDSSLSLSSEAAEFFRDYIQPQIPEELGTPQEDYDLMSLGGFSESESAHSFVPPANETELYNPNAAPGLKSPAFPSSDADLAGRVTQSANMKTSEDRTRQGRAGPDHSPDYGRPFEASPYLIALDSDYASDTHAMAGDFEKFYEDITSDAPDYDPRNPQYGCSSRGMVKVSYATSAPYKPDAYICNQQRAENQEESGGTSEITVGKQRRRPYSDLGTVEDELSCCSGNHGIHDPCPQREAIMARVEELFLEEDRLLNEEDVQQDWQYRLEQVLEERRKLLAQLTSDDEYEGCDTHDAPSHPIEAAAKALAELSMEATPSTGTINGHGAAEGSPSATKEGKGEPTTKNGGGGEL